MPIYDAGELQAWSPDLFPYDTPGASGTCRFAPNCGGVKYGENADGTPKMSRADQKGCPNLPAEFAERLGMNEATAESGTGNAAGKRYMAICRPRAERRFGAKAVRETEAQAGG